MRDFTQLEVWRRSHELVLEIYRVTKAFPNIERFRLTDQLCRSASSIPANIAEGKGRNTLKEYLQFLYIARGSLEETRYHLLLAQDLSYLEGGDYQILKARCDQIGKLLNGLINSLKQVGQTRKNL